MAWGGVAWGEGGGKTRGCGKVEISAQRVPQNWVPSVFCLELGSLGLFCPLVFVSAGFGLVSAAFCVPVVVLFPLRVCNFRTGAETNKKQAETKKNNGHQTQPAETKKTAETKNQRKPKKQRTPTSRIELIFVSFPICFPHLFGFRGLFHSRKMGSAAFSRSRLTPNLTRVGWGRDCMAELHYLTTMHTGSPHNVSNAPKHTLKTLRRFVMQLLKFCTPLSTCVRNY